MINHFFVFLKGQKLVTPFFSTLVWQFKLAIDQMLKSKEFKHITHAGIIIVPKAFKQLAYILRIHTIYTTRNTNIYNLDIFMSSHYRKVALIHYRDMGHTHNRGLTK